MFFFLSASFALLQKFVKFLVAYSMFSGKKIHQNFDFLIFEYFFSTTFELRFYLLAFFF